MGKKRTRDSYRAKTPEAKRRQMGGLIPGSIYRKRHVSEVRLNCFWKCLFTPDMQVGYEAYENKRFAEDTPKKQLKSKEYLNEWWSKLDLEDKNPIYKFFMSLLTREDKSKLYDKMQECLKIELEGDFEGLKEG